MIGQGFASVVYFSPSVIRETLAGLKHEPETEIMTLTIYTESDVAARTLRFLGPTLRIWVSHSRLALSVRAASIADCLVIIAHVEAYHSLVISEAIATGIDGTIHTRKIVSNQSPALIVRTRETR